MPLAFEMFAMMAGQDGGVKRANLNTLTTGRPGWTFPTLSAVERCHLGVCTMLSKAFVYPGGSHGLADTDRDQLNADLLAFLKS